MARRRARTTYNYTMKDTSGRVAKYGVTNNPYRRATENARDGFGTTMEITGPRVTRRTALRRESSKISRYESRYGRKPRGNKRR